MTSRSRPRADLLFDQFGGQPTEQQLAREPGVLSLNFASMSVRGPRPQKKVTDADREGLLRVFNLLSKAPANSKKSALTRPSIAANPINVDSLMNALRILKYKCTRRSVEDMLWEIDEDGDGAVIWEEFESAFYRIRNDESGCARSARLHSKEKSMLCTWEFCNDIAPRADD